MVSTEENVLRLPAASVAVAQTAYVPSARLGLLKVHCPLPAGFTGLPRETGAVLQSRNSSTRVPTVAFPVNVGVSSRVMLSVFEIPVSLVAVRSGVVGAVGGVRSITKFGVMGVEFPLTLPARSVVRAVTL